MLQKNSTVLRDGSTIEISAIQNSFINSIPTAKTGDIKFLNTILTVVFGSDVLVKSSITGKSKKLDQASIPLDKFKLAFVKGKYNYRKFINTP